MKQENEETCVENKAKRREKKRVDSCTEREAGGLETLVARGEGAYEPNGTLMVNGGLR